MNVTHEQLIANPPSSIRLGLPPLVGTLGSAEIEHAVALLVRACHVRGDRWAPMLWEELQDVLRADMDAKTNPVYSLLRNPFFSPQFDRTVEKGWAAWHGKPGVGKLELAPRTIMTIAAKYGAPRG